MMKFFLVLLAGALLASAQIPPECTNPVSQLETKDVPVLDVANSGFLSANTLTLVISATLVNDRADASIVLSATEAACNYPGPNWVRSQDDASCSETWTATMSWAQASQCDLIRTETADEITFTGEIAVIQEETLGSVRGTAITRDLSTGFQYEITFPRSIELTSPSIRVFAPVDVQAAVIGQDFAVLESTGNVLLFTSVQYPFMLTNGAVSTQLADGTTIQIQLPVGQNCPANAPCETTYNFQLAPGACTLTGGYTLTFDFECHPDYTESNCPLQGENGSVQFTLESPDLCAVLQENVDLAGELRSYLPDYATLRDAFLLDQVSYWQASVSSSKVSIADSQITAVSTSYDGGAQESLYAAGAPTASGTLAEFALDGNGGQAEQSRFRFRMLAALYPVPADEFRTAVVSATVAVTYQNAAAKREVTRYATVPLRLPGQGLGGHSLVRREAPAAALEERAVPTSQEQPLDCEARVGLSRPILEEPEYASEPEQEEAGSAPRPHGEPQPEEEAGTGWVPYVFLAALASMCCCGLLVVVAVRRRRQQAQEQPQHDLEQAPTPVNNLRRGSNSAGVARTSSKTVEGKVYDKLAA